MKVLYFVNAFPRYDAPYRGYFNYKTATELSNYVDLRVVTMRTWRPFMPRVMSNRYEKFEVHTIFAHFIPFKIPFKEIIDLPIIQLTDYKIFRELASDVDIVHSVGLANGILAGKWCCRLKKRHISQVIGTDLNIEAPKIIRSPIIKSWVNGVDAIICNSKDLEKKARALFPEVKDIRTIYRGINLEAYSDIYKAGFLSDEGRTFLYLGGIAYRPGTGRGRDYKGGLTLMKAWQLAERKGLNSKSKLILAGYDTQSKICQNWRKGLLRPENVELLGLVNPENVLSLLKRSHVVVIPSYYEGMPNVLLEAIASGRLVLASKTGGIPEVINDGETGFLFNPGDIEGLSDRIVNISSLDTNTIKLMAEKIYSILKINFDIKNTVKDIISVYNDTDG